MSTSPNQTAINMEKGASSSKQAEAIESYDSLGPMKGKLLEKIR
jgi:hypothetical protein